MATEEQSSSVSAFQFLLIGSIGTEQVRIPFVTEHCVDVYIDDLRWACNKYLFTVDLLVYNSNVQVAKIHISPTKH